MNRLKEITILIGLLEKAASLVSEYRGAYSGGHLSAEDFHRDLLASIGKLKNGRIVVLEDLWIWFAPTCQWDDLVGDVNLGNEVFNQIEKVKIIIK